MPPDSCRHALSVRSAPWGPRERSSRLLSVTAREKRAPLWALAAPGLYLAACLAALRAVLVDRSDVGVAGILLAVGLAPAFVIPAVFDTRSARLMMSDGGLAIDGVLQRVEEARVERGGRGTAVLHLVTRGGRARSFIVESYQDAERLVAMLPPVSAPAGALAA